MIPWRGNRVNNNEIKFTIEIKLTKTNKVLFEGGGRSGDEKIIRS